MKANIFLGMTFLMLVLGACTAEELTTEPKSSVSEKDMLLLEKEIINQYYGNAITRREEIPRSTIKTRSVTEPLTDWMADLPDDIYMSEVNIPGTHETCARVGGPLVQCQHLSLEEQLNAGVRFLDIRCRHIGDGFAIHHGPVYQNLTFGNDVRNVCINFLNAHPNEFIVMMVKPEHTEENCTRPFELTMENYIKGFENYFYLTEKMPTVGEIRGKIVLLRRFDDYSSTIPLGNKINFQDKATFSSFTTIKARVQDKYYVAVLWDRDWKWQQVKSLLEEAKSSNEKSTLFINYGSGSSTGCYPYSVAAYVNPKIENYLRGSDDYARCGTIMIDFVHTDNPAIPQLIISKNRTTK